jgi:exonuclease SbcC
MSGRFTPILKIWHWLMIPIHLSLSGFLSYRDPVEIDFNAFDLACIAGPNGAGKSSLLDAITWALFGQARKRDDSLINAHSAAAEVNLTFAYEGNLYMVQRIKPRDRTTLLEFRIFQDAALLGSPPPLSYSSSVPVSGSWKPLTERSLRETEARIQQTLRMDYEVFTNASFFLQGKADQFTQQRAADRKRILSSILGLDAWEGYKDRAAERRKGVEAEIRSLDGRLQEIGAELAEETARRQRLQEQIEILQTVSQQRSAQEKIVQNARQVAGALREQERLVETLARQAKAASFRLDDLLARLLLRQQESQQYAEILSRSVEIEAAYAAWQSARSELERLEQFASQFRLQEKEREAPLAEIQAECARLEQEQQTLLASQAEMAACAVEMDVLRVEADAEEKELSAAQQSLQRRALLDEALQSARQRQAEARAENPRLKAEMEELKARIDQLSAAEGAECPLCGQPLGEDDRLALVERLGIQGREMGDRYRANQSLLQQSNDQVRQLEEEIAGMAQAESESTAHTQRLAQLTARLDVLAAAQVEWQERRAPRLVEISRVLQDASYAAETRARLARIDADLKKIGYDVTAHDLARQAEQTGRASETEFHALERSRAALAPLQREIADLQAQIAAQQEEAARQQDEYQAAAAGLAAAQAQAPDLYQAENELFNLQERENRLRLEVGAAQQKVAVLEDLKTRRKALEAQREDLAGQVRQYKHLERAFGKDGVPALLIEQALPEIESKANDILARLSGGSMSVRFVTQAAYKDKSRNDLRETLDIQISDSVGTRDYEMFSGGEAFRVNFAIRLALSEVLTQRAGARLQTLVIDEGFGSQDAQGRQRLIEAINLVRPDFAKILVITHIDELKDAFPNRIEIEKTDMGSVIQVV